MKNRRPIIEIQSRNFDNLQHLKCNWDDPIWEISISLVQILDCMGGIICLRLCISNTSRNSLSLLPTACFNILTGAYVTTKFVVSPTERAELILMAYVVTVGFFTFKWPSERPAVIYLVSKSFFICSYMHTDVKNSH